MRKISGFTLIEMLVAMVIMGIVTGLVILSAPKSAISDIEQFRRLFVAGFGELRATSVALQKQYALQFNTSSIQLLTYQNNEWRVVGMSSSDSLESQATEDAEDNEADMSDKTSTNDADNSDKLSSESNEQAENDDSESDQTESVSPWLELPKNADINLYVNDNLLLLEDAKPDISPVPHIIIASNMEVSPFELQIYIDSAQHTFKASYFGELEYELR